MKYGILSFVSGCIALAASIALGVCLAGCLPGWTQLSPADAYRIESRKCAQKQGDERWQCQNLVDHKYAQYNSEGSYPSSRPGQRCSSPEDCR